MHNIEIPDVSKVEPPWLGRDSALPEGNAQTILIHATHVHDQIIIDNSVIDQDLEDRRTKSPRSHVNAGPTDSYRNQGAKFAEFACGGTGARGRMLTPPNCIF